MSISPRVIQSGTHVGEFVGIPATGVDATWTIIAIWRIECGKIAEQWSEADGLAFFAQVGLLKWPPIQASLEVE
jgi:predicted ester cyclase